MLLLVLLQVLLLVMVIGEVVVLNALRWDLLVSRGRALLQLQTRERRLRVLLREALLVHVLAAVARELVLTHEVVRQHLRLKAARLRRVQDRGRVHACRLVEQL